MVNATTIGDEPAGSVGMASVLARTLGGAKAGNTLFTHVTPAPTMTFAGTREKPATAATVGATASVATAVRITL
jgi:hypothetical protein